MRTQVIAEIGINHQNDLKIARELIELAATSGAQTVKFQCSTVREEVSFRHAPDHFRELGALVPTTDFLRECRRICDDTGVEFLCTPSGPESLEIVVELGVLRIKVASDNLNNEQFLELARDTGLPLILSTGMAEMPEIQRAVQITEARQILHCVSLYPCPPHLANLNAIQSLQEAFPYRDIGYSDHTADPFTPVLAVAVGAQIIEKHLTLDHAMPGPDHRASMDPLQWVDMMKAIGGAEKVLGTGHKIPAKEEEAAAKRYRKSLTATRFINKGEVIGRDMVTSKRPGTGFPADGWHSILGTIATRDIEEDEQF